MNIETKAFCTKAGRAAGLMKGLANAHRLMILCRLHEGECSVGELEKLVKLNQSALSQHLARLRRDGIVQTRREAQTIYYRLADVQAAKIIEQLYSLFCHNNPKSKDSRRTP
jgi:ArsR family transcriptional regulator, virulence genes transcriptional regulator